MSQNSGKIQLYGLYKRGGIVSSVSPFVSKVETFLKMNEIPYEGILASPLSGPKGKVPYIKHGDQTVADSTFIIDYLIKHFEKEGKKLKVTKPESLQDQAVSTACQRVVEEQLYFIMMYFLFFDDAGWSRQKDHFLAEFFSPMLRSLVVPVARYQFCGALKSQGVGRLTHEEILKLAEEDLQMINTFLGDKKFLTGDIPVIADCAVFGLLDNCLHLEKKREDGTLENPFANLILQKFPGLVKYGCRIRQQFFNDVPTDSFCKLTWKQIPFKTLKKLILDNEKQKQ